MLKTVMKELIILLLLLLAILLVLGVFLYDYIPTNKIVPKIEQYQVPNAIKQELEDSAKDIDEQKTQIVYEIDGTDLKNYEKAKDYQKGKANPFGQDGITSNQGSQNTNNNVNNNSSADQNTNTSNNNSANKTNTNSNNVNNTNNSNSVGNYLPNTGTK